VYNLFALYCQYLGGNEMNYLKIDFDYIKTWCVENNQVAWLKAVVNETTKAKRHTGKIQVEKKGKMVWVVDKNSPTEEVEIPITFVEIKTKFIEKFMPEIMPVKKVKKTMRDIIAEL
jgi:hypothetical protein